MSNEALHTSICGVCVRECKSKICLECLLCHIPNHELLIPATVHPHMTLMNGLLVTDDAVYNTSDVQQAIAVCFQCDSDLTKNQLPLYALMNGLWIGRRPSELTSLTIPEQMLITLVYPHWFIFKMHPVTMHGQDPSTLQCSMVSNIMSYDMDTTEIIAMLEGCKMPRPTHILASVIAVTFVGRGHIPKNWLKSTF
jgi:hypothetical protein